MSERHFPTRNRFRVFAFLAMVLSLVGYFNFQSASMAPKPFQPTHSAGGGTSAAAMPAFNPLQGGAPVVHQFYPIAAAPGATILITGSGFSSDAQVLFGGTRRIPAPRLTVVSSTLLHAVVPNSGVNEANINGYLTVASSGIETTTQALPDNGLDSGNPAVTYPSFALLGDVTGDGLTANANDVALVHAQNQFQIQLTRLQTIAADVVPLNANGSRGNGAIAAADETFLKAVSQSQTTFCSSSCIVPPRVQFNESGAYRVFEGNAGTTSATVTVTRTGDATVSTSINFAVTDGTALQPVDYASTSGTLDFAAGETSKTFAVTINGDATVEPDETVTLTLTPNPNITTSVARPCLAGPDRTRQVIQLTIANDDVACSAITMTPTLLPNATQGTAYSQALAGNGGTSPYAFAIVSGGLPGGMTLTSAGLLSGTPTVSGTANFTVQAADNRGCFGTQNFALTVDPSGGGTCNGTFGISPIGPALPDGETGQPYSQLITSKGAAQPFTVQLSGGALPIGLFVTSNGTSGSISGTPRQGGTFNFTIKVTGNDNVCKTVNYTLRIITNCPPIIVGPPSLPEGTLNQTYGPVILAAGGGASPYTFEVASGLLPPGLALSTAGAISGRPTSEGSFSFTVRAADAFNCSGFKDYLLLVGRPCDPVTVNPVTLPNGTLGTAYSQTVTATGPASSYSFFLESGTLPAGLTLATTGLIWGTPTAAGTYPFTVRATAGNCSGTRAYSVTIGGGCGTVSVLPISADLPPATEGTNYNTTFSASGGTPTYHYTVTLGTLPTGLSLADNGTLSGTPTVNGTSTFTIRATDAQNCFGERQYSLVVQHVGSNCGFLSLDSNPASIPAGTAGVSYPGVTFTASPENTYGYGIVGGALPAGMTLASTGGLTGTPTAPGSFSFTVRATVTSNPTCFIDRQFVLTILSPSNIGLIPDDQPQDKIVAYGDRATLSVVPVGNGPFTYTWYAVDASGIEAPAAGANNQAEYTTEAITDSAWFRVRVRDGNGAEAYSRIATVIPNDPDEGQAPIVVDSLDPVAGSAGPSFWIIFAGSNLSTNLSVVFEKPNGERDTDIEVVQIRRFGDNTRLSVEARVRQTAQPGVRNVKLVRRAKQSNVKTFTVNAPYTAPQIDNPPDKQIMAGTGTRLEVGALGAGPFTYQWYRGERGNTLQPVPGATSAALDTGSLQTTAQYWVRVRQGDQVADSRTVTVQVVNTQNNAAYVEQGVSTQMASGQKYTVTVVMQNTGNTVWTAGPEGGTNHFLRSVSTTNTDWGKPKVQVPHNIPPQAFAVFTFEVTAPSTAGTYSFKWRMFQEGSGNFGQATPDVSITVTASQPDGAPVIDQQPQSQTICTGDTASFRVTAHGQGTLTYRWFMGSPELPIFPPNNTDPSFTTPPLTTNTNVYVEVSNGIGPPVRSVIVSVTVQACDFGISGFLHPENGVFQRGKTTEAVMIGDGLGADGTDVGRFTVKVIGPTGLETNDVQVTPKRVQGGHQLVADFAVSANAIQSSEYRAIFMQQGYPAPVLVAFSVDPKPVETLDLTAVPVGGEIPFRIVSATGRDTNVDLRIVNPTNQSDGRAVFSNGQETMSILVPGTGTASVPVRGITTSRASRNLVLEVRKQGSSSIIDSIPFTVVKITVSKVSFSGNTPIVLWNSGRQSPVAEIGEDGAVFDPNTPGFTQTKAAYPYTTKPTVFAQISVLPTDALALGNLPATFRVKKKGDTLPLGTGKPELLTLNTNRTQPFELRQDPTQGESRLEPQAGIKVGRYTFVWEISFDNGATWSPAGQGTEPETGIHTIYWTYSQPRPTVFTDEFAGTSNNTLYDRSLEWACGFVAGGLDGATNDNPAVADSTVVVDRIAQGIASKLVLYPANERLGHPLEATDDLTGGPSNHAVLMAGLLRSIGLTADTRYVWSGTQQGPNPFEFVTFTANSGVKQNVSLQLDRAGYDRVEANPHFLYYPIVAVQGFTQVYDPSYANVPGLLKFDQFTFGESLVSGSTFGTNANKVESLRLPRLPDPEASKPICRHSENGEIVSLNIYPGGGARVFYAGAEFIADFQVKNTGQTTWPAGTVITITPISNCPGCLNYPITDLRFGLLTAPLSPGQVSQNLRYWFRAPSVPGDYNASFKLFHSGLGSTFGVASSPLTIRFFPVN